MTGAMKREEWRTLFDDAKWREKLAAALREVAGNRDSDPSDRSVACALWSGLVDLGLVPGPTSKTVPEMIRDVHLDLLALGRLRNETTAQAMHDLLTGARLMIVLAMQFEPVPEALAEAMKKADESYSAKPAKVPEVN